MKAKRIFLLLLLMFTINLRSRGAAKSTHKGFYCRSFLYFLTKLDQNRELQTSNVKMLLGGFLIEAKTGKTYLGEAEQSKAIGEDDLNLDLNRIEIVYDWPAQKAGKARKAGKRRKNKKRRRRRRPRS